MTILGLITARGGSKGIPKKNIKLLAGKPLIVWTIEAALKCHDLGRIIVSTDDKKIADVARHWGAEVPFVRPTALAQDDSSHIEVVLHAVGWLEREGYIPDYVMLLQPTSPLRSEEDMYNAIHLAAIHHVEAVVSVCVAKKHPYKTYKLTENGTLRYFIPTNISYLYRQALPKVYEENGAIYLNRLSSLRHDRTFLPEGAIPYVMPAERSLDIDTPWDFHLAELVLRNPMPTKEQP